MAKISVKEFADLAGVSEQAIRKAANPKVGRLIADENNLLDTEQERNAEYLAQKKATKSPPPESPDIVIPEAKPSGTGGKKKSASKFDADEKWARVRAQKAEVALAKDVETLILRPLVRRVFGVLDSVIVNNFHQNGEKITPAIAKICKIVDPEILLEIKRAIDTETAKSLEAYQAALKSEIANFKFEDDKIEE